MNFKITDKDLKSLTPNMRKLIWGLSINSISYILISILLALLVFYYDIVFGIASLVITLFFGVSDLWNIIFKLLRVIKKGGKNE